MAESCRPELEDELAMVMAIKTREEKKKRPGDDGVRLILWRGWFYVEILIILSNLGGLMCNAAVAYYVWGWKDAFRCSVAILTLGHITNVAYISYSRDISNTMFVCLLLFLSPVCACLDWLTCTFPCCAKWRTIRRYPLSSSTLWKQYLFYKCRYFSLTLLNTMTRTIPHLVLDLALVLYFIQTETPIPSVFYVALPMAVVSILSSAYIWTYSFHRPTQIFYIWCVVMDVFGGMCTFAWLFEDGFSFSSVILLSKEILMMGVILLLVGWWIVDELKNVLPWGWEWGVIGIRVLFGVMCLPLFVVVFPHVRWSWIPIWQLFKSVPSEWCDGQLLQLLPWFRTYTLEKLRVLYRLGHPLRSTTEFGKLLHAEATPKEWTYATIRRFTGRSFCHKLQDPLFWEANYIRPGRQIVMARYLLLPLWIFGLLYSIIYPGLAWNNNKNNAAARSLTVVYAASLVFMAICLAPSVLRLAHLMYHLPPHYLDSPRVSWTVALQLRYYCQHQRRIAAPTMTAFLAPPLAKICLDYLPPANGDDEKDVYFSLFSRHDNP